MTFVQLIDCKTSKYEDMNRLMDTWVEATQGKRTATHSLIGKDRAAAGHYIEIIEFPSYEEAMKNSGLPETHRIFEEMVALCDETPTFTDLDVVRDEQLNKESAARFLLYLCGHDNPAGFNELFTPDYHERDIANAPGTDTRGPDGLREKTLTFRRAFPDFSFTIEDQIAEGDTVATRWSWRGTQTGELRGIPPTGKPVHITGTTVFTFKGPQIQEGWWHWDYVGMLRQLGAIDVPA